MKNRRCLQALLVLTLGFVILLGGGLITAAAASPPPWQQSLQCVPDQQQFEGVAYCAAIGDASIHVIVVNLNSPGIRLEYVLAKGVNKDRSYGECKDVNIPQWGPVNGGCADRHNSNLYPVLSLQDAINRIPTAAAIVNSDYFSPKRAHGPEGFTVVHGDRLDGPANGDQDNNAVRRPWLAVSRGAPLRAEISQFAPGQDNGGKPNWVYTGVGGGPWLIKKGVIQEQDISSCRNTSGASCRSGVDQTAVGLSQNHQWLFLVVDQRRTKLLDTADFMRNKLDAWDAMKFDGGSSTQLSYAGQIITKGKSRKLSQYLAVTAQPGHGIGFNGMTAWAADPTSPLFFAVVTVGETAHVHVEVQNTGTTTWKPQQIGLKIVGGVSHVAAVYPLSHVTAPGTTAGWDLSLASNNFTFATTHLRMVRDGEPFGAEITVLVIAVPQRLKSQEERIRQLVQRQVEKWQQEGQRETDRMLRDLERQLQREMERQAKDWFTQLCGGDLALGLSPLFLAMFLSRRKRKK